MEKKLTLCANFFNIMIMDNGLNMMDPPSGSLAVPPRYTRLGEGSQDPPPN